jgi:hypothetical protein
MNCKSTSAAMMSLLALTLSVYPILRSTVAAGQSPDHPQPESGAFATPLTNALIDDSALAEAADETNGAVHLLEDPASLRQVIWTQSSAPSAFHPFEFGNSSRPGIRYLRLGFREPVPTGSVLVRGGGQLSVLRPGATYPGNLFDDTQWIQAQRIVNHQLSTAEVDAESYALWVLPPGTKTRALRFTHVVTQTDKTYAGELGGVYVLSGRFTNLAPQATAIVSANMGAAPLLTDEKYNSGRAWDNGPDFSHAVTRETPEWITLIWPHSVSLHGLAALWAGFNAADVQVFAGSEKSNPQAAPDADWHPIGQAYTLRNQYPRLLGIDWMDFGKTIQTRAVRVRITQVTDERHHQHLAGSTRNGNRVWLGELMAVSPLDSVNLQALAAISVANSGPNPPIPVHFTLDAPAYVTLVIDDSKGNRVRNLISDTLFQAGANTVWWDGADDLGRTPDAATHGVYLIPTHFVAPGRYRVHGLSHKAIDLHYEFSVYNGGYPAWDTADGKGGWLTNHTPPSAALFLPADKAPGGKPLVYLGSYISEGGSGLAWVDLEGHKQGGRGWIGGTWTGAPYLARDAGPQADSNVYAYVASVWGDDSKPSATFRNVVLRLTALTGNGDKSILKYPFTGGEKIDADETRGKIWTNQIGGLAVHNNTAVVSLTRVNQLLFVDTVSGKIIRQTPADSPRGIAFDAAGSLLVLSGQRLLRYPAPGDAAQAQPQVLISTGLEDPAGITLDSDGTLYISDGGASNQIKVFDHSGKLLRSIGHAGLSIAGPYDPLHMNHPRGLAIDSNRHLWVAEDDFQPKRVSLWTLDGSFIKAFYGPAEYGGGGALDPQDKTKFYYHGMEFKLDWKTGSNTLSTVLYRPAKGDPQPPESAPVNVLYSSGHRYFTNSYLDHPTSGVGIGMLYLDEGGVLRPVAALGNANSWKMFQSELFRSYLPPGADLTSGAPGKSLMFTWSDVNGNGKVEPEEVSFLKSPTGSITIMSDPKAPGPVILDAAVDGKAMRYAPVKVTPAGVPVYDLYHGEAIVEGAQRPPADGGGQMLYSAQATVLTTAPLPFAREGVGGIDSQGHRWSYPSLWPGLHPGHSAPVPDHPGELVGTTRLLGGFIKAPDATVGELWGINNNFGAMYLFTANGLFVTQLFQDVRIGKPWSMPIAQRDMLLNDVSTRDENFYPSLTQTSDGKVYVVDGARASIVRVDGLDTVKCLPDSMLEISEADIQKAQSYLKEREQSRQDSSAPQVLEVAIRPGPAPALKDLIPTLVSAKWATIDHRITRVGWGDKPDIAEAAIIIEGGRLYAAYHTKEPELLKNSGSVANAPFKTGGALDLMIGTDSNADPRRTAPVEGDLRLLVYQINGQTQALLYKPVVPGTKNSVPFSSPDRTITIDQVLDVSKSVELDSSNGNYTFSIPLETLGLKPRAGEKIKADIGILRGNGIQTTQRVYWSDKATGITADVPSEAELTPALWGDWIFKQNP